ncbi:hypothetical protein E2C01_037736 [Portunus trituberculatus]|uniref:Uncharacterized protein n=1 Tax=Portunus trituberculatus TaxID=210409 RepID=A0A5B7FET8_PORTR|nr:hypothetical protein [Portunus trituberculatus]
MLSNLPSFPPHSLTKFNSAVCLPHNSSDYSKFFNYLTCKVEHILSLYPFAEISSLEISMFTTSFGFPLPSLTTLVNRPSTLLSSMT